MIYLWPLLHLLLQSQEMVCESCKIIFVSVWFPALSAFVCRSLLEKKEIPILYLGQLGLLKLKLIDLYWCLVTIAIIHKSITLCIVCKYCLNIVDLRVAAVKSTKLKLL